MLGRSSKSVIEEAKPILPGRDKRKRPGAKRGPGAAKRAPSETVVDATGRLQNEVDELKAREEALSDSYRKLEEQVELASRVHRKLIGSELPVIKDVDLEVIYQPLEAISGDLYSVARLDKTQVGISLIDATGHGLAAALVSVYIKQLLDPKTNEGGKVSVVEPAEILKRINRVLCESSLDESQFVAGLHAVYDEKKGVIRWVRGGLPYPILVRKGKAPQLIESEGPLIGVFTEARFEVVELKLEPGDRLYMFSDGLEALIAESGKKRRGVSLQKSSWFKGLRQASMADGVAMIREQLARIRPGQWDADDVTVVALEVR